MMNDFRRETDDQIARAVEALSRIESIRAPIWSRLDLPDRMAALQRVEDELASIQERPSVPVHAEELDPGVYGAFDGERIIIDLEQVAGGHVPIDELVDTIIHEGRHAYQQFVVEHPEVVSDADIPAMWGENLEHYLDAETYGQFRYVTQPIEADAWSYAERIRRALYRSS